MGDREGGETVREGTVSERSSIVGVVVVEFLSRRGRGRERGRERQRERERERGRERGEREVTERESGGGGEGETQRESVRAVGNERKRGWWE